MRYKQNTTRIKSWEKKWNRFSNKTQTYLTRSRKNTKPHQNKLKKDPIMALVTRTISTYMLIKHSKNGKEKSDADNLSPWGEPFFSKKDHTAGYQYKPRMPRSPESSKTTKEETTTEWFLRNLATSPFPIQAIRTLGKALNILTNTSPENE